MANLFRHNTTCHVAQFKLQSFQINWYSYLRSGLVRWEGGKEVQSTGAPRVLRGPAALMLEKLSYVAVYSIAYWLETAYLKLCN